MTIADPNDSTGNAPRRPRILVVDDHEIGRKSLARLLDLYGYEITAAKDGESALAALELEPSFDYILTDLRLPDLDGREIVRAARRLRPLPQIGLITGWDVEAGEALRLGIDFVFLKPLDVQAIVAWLKQSPPHLLPPSSD